MNWEKIFKLAQLFNILVFAGKVDDLQLKYPEFKNQIKYLSDNDPTGNNKYLDYAVKVLVSKQALEPEIADVIKLFHKNIHKLENKDINSYKNFTELRDLLFEVDDKKSKTQEKKDIKQGGTERIYEDEQCIVLLIKDKDAACHYGFGTKWCITMSEEKYYEDYTSANVVFYFVISKTISKEDDVNYKVALAVERDLKNKVINIQYFDSEDRLIYPDHLPEMYKNWNTIIGLIRSNAVLQPKGLLAKIDDGTASIDEIFDNLNEKVFTEFLIKYDSDDNKYTKDQIDKLVLAANKEVVSESVRTFLRRHEEFKDDFINCTNGNVLLFLTFNIELNKIPQLIMHLIKLHDNVENNADFGYYFEALEEAIDRVKPDFLPQIINVKNPLIRTEVAKKIPDSYLPEMLKNEFDNDITNNYVITEIARRIAPKYLLNIIFSKKLNPNAKHVAMDRYGLSNFMEYIKLHPEKMDETHKQYIRLHPENNKKGNK